MPIADNMYDRLKAAIVPANVGADDGAPALVMGDPSGWSVIGASAINTAATLTQNPDADERQMITGYSVALTVSAKNSATVNILGSGAGTIWRDVVASGANGVSREFNNPLFGGLASTVQLYFGPAGASVIAVMSFKGYSIGGN